MRTRTFVPFQGVAARLSQHHGHCPSFNLLCGETMRVFVNDKPVDILPGMKVKHALIAAGIPKEIEAAKKVYDEWGNEVGLDGALAEGMKIYLK